MRPSTKYQPTSFSNVCTNPDCGNGLPRYRGFGLPAQKNCAECGQPMRRIKGEPGGTYHPPRR